MPRIYAVKLGCLLLTSVLFVFASKVYAGSCQFYAFVDHGVTAEQKKVFRSSGVRMYQAGLSTAYGPRGEVNKNGFTMVLLGPFVNSSTAKKSLNKRLAQLNAEGYIKKKGNQGMPRIFLLNKKLCHSRAS